MITGTVVSRRDGYHRGAVYIGRPSPFGNPFHIGADGTRTEVLAKFEAWARQRLSEDVSFRLAVENLRGQQLECWCAPLACHGDVLLRLAEELAWGAI